MTTPLKGRKSTATTPSHKTDEISQGNEDLAALMTSKKGIMFVILLSVIITVLSIVIFNTLGNRATTIWAIIVVALLFAIRHFIGNIPTKISNID